jgi:hypothetical protein
MSSICKRILCGLNSKRETILLQEHIVLDPDTLLNVDQEIKGFCGNLFRISTQGLCKKLTQTAVIFRLDCTLQHSNQ